MAGTLLGKFFIYYFFLVFFIFFFLFFSSFYLLGSFFFLTGALGRLFTAYLQMRGFTCAMEDLLLNDTAEKERLKLIQKSLTVGHLVCLMYMCARVAYT